MNSDLYLKENELKDNQFIIPAHNLEWVNQKLVKYNKKAKKLGFDPFEVSVVQEFSRKNEDEEFIIDYLVELTGAKAVIAGWEIIAYTELVNSSNVVSRFGSGLDESIDLKEYRDRVECDHCKSNVRRYYTYILKSVETGELKQVGTECVKDFIGHDPKGVLRYAQYTLHIKEMFDSIDDDGYFIGKRNNDYFYIIEYIAKTICYLRTTNSAYMSKTKANELSTYEEPVTSTASHINLSYDRNAKEHGLDINPEHKDYLTAKKVYNFFKYYHRIKGVDKNDLPDYFYTLHTILERPYSDWKFDGYVCSMYSSFLRETDRIKINKKRTEERKESNWIGKVGDKVDMKLTLVFNTSFETAYGRTYLYKFEDEDKNSVVWMSSVYYEVSDNKEWNLRGTIKNHNEYKGEKQTLVTRCKMEKVA